MTRTRIVRGDIVEVLSPADIVATLDAEGCLDGLPFMPEMTTYCGKKYRVHRRADRTCVEGLGMRRLHRTVFLEELRCDGAGHDGCQRGCLMFWKEAWLKPVAAHNGTIGPTPVADPAAAAALNARLPTRSGDTYVCQSTALATTTSPLSFWSPLLLVREMIDGELAPGRFLAIVARTLVNRGRIAISLAPVGALRGTRTRPPKGDLHLASGERVTIKPGDKIVDTLDPKGRNCGLSFEPDMAEFTGKTFEVDAPVTRIIQERSGRMTQLASTVTLKGIGCHGLCAKNCPRNNPVYWREIWLDRAEDAVTAEPVTKNAPATAA